jgi:hypothetical protein
VSSNLLHEEILGQRVDLLLATGLTPPVRDANLAQDDGMDISSMHPGSPTVPGTQASQMESQNRLAALTAPINPSQAT